MLSTHQELQARSRLDRLTADWFLGTVHIFPVPSFVMLVIAHQAAAQLNIICWTFLKILSEEDRRVAAECVKMCVFLLQTFHLCSRWNAPSVSLC